MKKPSNARHEGKSNQHCSTSIQHEAPSEVNVLQYRIFVVPLLTFPLREITLRLEDLITIQTHLVPMICQGIHMHRRANHDYLFGPSRFWGMETTLYVVNTNEHRLTMLIDHLERDNAMKKMFWESLYGMHISKSEVDGNCCPLHTCTPIWFQNLG